MAATRETTSADGSMRGDLGTPPSLPAATDTGSAAVGFAPARVGQTAGVTTAPPEPVLVPLDRRRLDRVWVPIVVLSALPSAIVLVGLWFVVHEGQPWLALPIGAMLLATLAQLAVNVAIWLGIRRVPTPLELRATGLVLRVSGGQVEAPWDAVASVLLERHWLGDRVRFRFVPTGDPRRAAVRTDLPPRRRKAVDRQGMVYALRVLDIEPARILAAVDTLSGGRTVTRPATGS